MKTLITLKKKLIQKKNLMIWMMIMVVQEVTTSFKLKLLIFQEWMIFQ